MKNLGEVKNVNTYSRKKRLLNFVKYAVFLLIAVFSYFASAYLHGLTKTNERLIILVVCTFLGIALFFIIYIILYAITAIKYSIRSKRKKDNTVNCDSLLTELITENNFKFNYDLRKSVNENLRDGVNISYQVVKEIANGYGNSGKYVYLDYTLYDALEIFGNAVDVVKVKADAIFSLLRLQDKPISLLEKKLTDIIEGQPIIEEEKPETVFSKINSGVKNVASKVALFALKGKISSLVNEIIEYVGFEAFRVFSKQNKEFAYKPEEVPIEDVKEATNAWIFNVFY